MEAKNINAEEIKQDIALLTNELIYHGYLFSHEKMQIQELNAMEYIALSFIAHDSEASSIYGDRKYLDDISVKMHLTMRQTSNMIGKLRDAGLVLWSHDGNGSEGTYVVITENGKEKLKKQEEGLKRFYTKVIEKFGADKMVRMLQLMKEMESVINSERQAEKDDDNE